MAEETLPTEYVLALPGVSHRTSKTKGLGAQGALELSLDDDFSLSEAQKLVDLVDDEVRLHFFDGDHPQRSDPGLYCYFQRHDGQLYAHGANHGWGYPLLEISSTAAARWLWLCTAHNDGRGYEGSVMRLRRSLPIDVDDLTGHDRYRQMFADWLNSRLTPEPPHSGQ